MHKLGRLPAVWCATGAACAATVFAAAGNQDYPKSSSSPSAAARSSPVTITNQNVQASRLSPPVADVLRLVESGVNEEVVKSYVNNSTTIYALTADDIVVLNQRGVPSGILVAMLTRSGELRSRMAAAAAAATPPAMPAQPAPAVTQIAPAYPAQQAVYAAEPVYPSTTYYNDYYPYPSYTYSSWNYPLYSSWWWTPSWSCYPYWRQHYPRYYGGHGWAGYRPPYRWADAYPNKLVAGPNWGADRGYNGWYAGRPGSRPGGWSGGYPGRVVAGPPRGATPNFSSRPVAYTGRIGGGAAPIGRGGGGFQAPRAGGGGFGGGGGRGRGGR